MDNDVQVEINIGTLVMWTLFFIFMFLFGYESCNWSLIRRREY